MLEPILIVAIVIAATAWYVRHKWQKRLRALAIRNPREGTVLELLARRYARGEIDRDEYLQKRYPATRACRQAPEETRAFHPCVRLSREQCRARGGGGTEITA